MPSNLISKNTFIYFETFCTNEISGEKKAFAMLAILKMLILRPLIKFYFI